MLNSHSLRADIGQLGVDLVGWGVLLCPIYAIWWLRVREMNRRSTFATAAVQRISPKSKGGA